MDPMENILLNSMLGWGNLATILKKVLDMSGSHKENESGSYRK